MSEATLIFWRLGDEHHPGHVYLSDEQLTSDLMVCWGHWTRDKAVIIYLNWKLIQFKEYLEFAFEVCLLKLSCEFLGFPVQDPYSQLILQFNYKQTNCSLISWVILCLVVDFYNRINLIVGGIQEVCTDETCPTMSGGKRFVIHVILLILL